MTDSRFLITTADQRTWAFDRPALFLGEWCRWYETRDVWGMMDAVVARPFCTAPSELTAYLDIARSTERALWPILVSALNNHHQLDRSERFWRVLLGNWLRRFVNIVINRSEVLAQAIREHEISATNTLAAANYHLATQTSGDFPLACNDPVWNNILYGRVLDLMGADVARDRIGADLPDGFQRDSSPNSPRKNVLGALMRNTDVYIDKSYLPRSSAAILHLALGQVPQLWRGGRMTTAGPVDKALRVSLGEKLPDREGTEALDLALRLLFELMPVCYLEGFRELSRQKKAAEFPTRPKAIFTSNNFDTDEVFKLWAAEQVEGGVPYIVGQHGGSYGTSRQFSPSPEEEYGDCFVTWGWERAAPKAVPAFNFRRPKPGTTPFDRNGGILLIEASPAYHAYLDDKVSRFEQFFADQIGFVRGLDPAIQQSVTVRLAGGSKHLHRGEAERWPAELPGIVIDTYEKPLEALVAASRLVVHSYDSTGILETLNQNIPTLAFWQGGLDHLLEEVRPDYDILIAAGIVHLSPESLSQKVNEVFADTSGWWAGDAIQAARRHFMHKYSRQVANPVSSLRRIIADQIAAKNRSDSRSAGERPTTA